MKGCFLVVDCRTAFGDQSFLYGYAVMLYRPLRLRRLTTFLPPLELILHQEMLIDP